MLDRNTQASVQTLELQLKEVKDVVLQFLNLGAGGQRAGDIASLEAKIKLLETRSPSVPNGRLGGEPFHSRADVLLFFEKYIPSNSFYLFHETITLLESLTNSHVERMEVLQEWYQSRKVGVNKATAHHMASFWLMLPSIFGQIKEGGNASQKHQLPAIKTFKEWNTFDGVSGVMSHIALGMDDINYQLHQDIEQAFGTDSMVKAREMHELSQNFVMELCTWIDAFYQELVSTSEAAEEEAWEVVGACMKKVFEMI